MQYWQQCLNESEILAHGVKLLYDHDYYRRYVQLGLPPNHSFSMNSESFFTDTDAYRSTVFSDFTVLPSHGYSLLVKAKRYGRWWLLKGLKEEYRNQTIYQTFLQKEYDILCQMQHPMVVSVFSYESVEDMGDCIVMEWIEGVTLKQWLQTSHSLKERRHIADMLTEALAYVHSQQTEHRDLKPSNVMITNDGHHLKLIDFGLSDTKSYTILKEEAGTEGYMAPDGPSDVYSLGVILRELRLGFFSHFVIRRCLAPRTRRISHFTDVRKALHRRWLWPRRIAAILLTVLLLSALYGLGLFYSSKRLRPEITAVQTVLTDSLNHMQASSQAATDSLQHRIIELETEKKAVEAQVQQYQSLIDAKKKQIDRQVRAYGIEQMLDTVSCRRNITIPLLRIADELLEDAKEPELKEYIQERYRKPWLKRMSELPFD